MINEIWRDFPGERCERCKGRVIVYAQNNTFLSVGNNARCVTCEHKGTLALTLFGDLTIKWEKPKRVNTESNVLRTAVFASGVFLLIVLASLWGVVLIHKPF